MIKSEPCRAPPPPCPNPNQFPIGFWPHIIRKPVPGHRTPTTNDEPKREKNRDNHRNYCEEKIVYMAVYLVRTFWGRDFRSKVEKKADRVIKHFRRTFPFLPGLAEREIDKSRFERATNTHTHTLLQAIFQRQSAGKAGLEKVSSKKPVVCLG